MLYDYRQAIKDFVGKDGFVAFEHGFKPEFCMWGVSDKEVCFSEYGRHNIDELTDKQARTVLRDLLEYLNYCKLYA